MRVDVFSRIGPPCAAGPVSIALSFLFALAACTSSPPATPPPTRGPFDLVGAPAEVRNRPPLPDCGTELGHPPAGFNPEARTCFWTAYVRGAQAEFISTRPAAGGQPLLVIWRSLGGGRVESYVDETRGGFAKRVWLRTDCPGLTLTHDPNVEPDWIPGLLGAGQTCSEHELSG